MAILCDHGNGRLYSTGSDLTAVEAEASPGRLPCAVMFAAILVPREAASNGPADDRRWLQCPGRVRRRSSFEQPQTLRYSGNAWH